PSPDAKLVARFAEPPWHEQSAPWCQIDAQLSPDHLAREIRQAMTHLDLTSLSNTCTGWFCIFFKVSFREVSQERGLEEMRRIQLTKPISGMRMSLQKMMPALPGSKLCSVSIAWMWIPAAPQRKGARPKMAARRISRLRHVAMTPINPRPTFAK